MSQDVWVQVPSTASVSPRKIRKTLNYGDFVFVALYAHNAYNKKVPRKRKENKTEKQRDLLKIASQQGFKYVKDGGRHDIYSNGEKEVAIPRHREINEITAKKIIRDMGA